MSNGGWYIVKQESGQCTVLAADQANLEPSSQLSTWGPYASQQEAIARRVGLIRAGKCQPA
ncbi:MAG TPA: hypothetical protein V6D18_05050 [Thermosynechococcaceae cyanobacterium]